jgi:hypothetical protein
MFLGEATWGSSVGVCCTFIVFLIGEFQRILIYRRPLLSFANVYYNLCLLVNSLVLGILSVGCITWLAEVAQGAALLQALTRHPLLNHY